MAVQGPVRAKVFDEVLVHCKPVFHHWFLERYATAMQWMASRHAFTRSMAANSMVNQSCLKIGRVFVFELFDNCLLRARYYQVGYVAGIGDRHVGNILIDTESGELVHIDHGVAFDQGRVRFILFESGSPDLTIINSQLKILIFPVFDLT